MLAQAGAVFHTLSELVTAFEQDAVPEHALAITFDDAVALLSAPGAEHLIVRTSAVVAGTPEASPGWDVVRTDVTTVPLAWESHRRHGGCEA